MPLAEYERSVGPVNKSFHEYAEAVLLYRQGILPLESDEQQQQAPITDLEQNNRVRTHR